MSKNTLAVQQVNTVKKLFEQNKDQLQAIVPKHIDFNRLLNIALVQIRRTPALLEVTPKSLLGCVVQSSQLGLEIDNVLGHAYLVPFYNGKTKTKEAQFIPGYKGLIKLALNSGKVSNIYARIVYQGDRFSIDYGEESISHVPCRPSERGEQIGVYSVARLKDGAKQFEFMYAEDVERIKKYSRSAWTGDGKVNTDSIWYKHETDMWKKTAIRQLVKFLELSPQTAKAVAMDEAAEAGVNFIEADWEDVPEGEGSPADAEPGMTEAEKDDLNGLMDVLGYNDAKKEMEIAAVRGDTKKISALKKRLEGELNTLQEAKK